MTNLYKILLILEVKEIKYEVYLKVNVYKACSLSLTPYSFQFISFPQLHIRTFTGTVTRGCYIYFLNLKGAIY